MNNIQEMIDNLLSNNQDNDCKCDTESIKEEIPLNNLFEPIYLYLNLLIKRIQNFYLNLLSLIWNEKNSEISNKLLNSFIDVILYNLFNNLENNNQNSNNKEDNNRLKYLPFDEQENKTIDEQILRNILHDRIRNKIL